MCIRDSHKPPVSSALDFQPLDHELVAAAPPLSNELAIGVRAPYPVARGVENALDTNLAIRRRGDRGFVRGFGSWGRHDSSFVRSRKSSSLLSRSFVIFRYVSIQRASSSSRRGPSRAVLT